MDDVLVLSALIFLHVIVEGAVIASVITVLLWAATVLERVLTKILKKGG